MWLNICKPLVMRYVLIILVQFFALGLLIMTFKVCAIIHQQAIAMLPGFMKFVCMKLSTDLHTFAEYKTEEVQGCPLPYRSFEKD